MAKSLAFKRFYKECKKISPHIRFKKVRGGFYRLYWDHSYLHEVYDNMPMRGYDWEFSNPRLESREYFEEYEDNVDNIRRFKNFVEGYYDAIERVRTRVYMHRHDKEFNKNAEEAYATMTIK